MAGRPVRFVTGTDEHGEKIAAAAAARSMEPQAHCDDIVAAFKQLWSKLDISYDAFVRTSSEEHAVVVRELLQRVWDKDVYRARYSGYYCVGCEEYKDELELGEDKACPIHRTRCDLREEENYFFALSHYQKALEDLLEGNPDFVQPASARNEVLAWVKAGLRDFSISRSRVAWGIPLPRDPTHTAYVWFDALAGYLTALLSLGRAEAGSQSVGDVSQEGGGTSSPATDATTTAASTDDSSKLDQLVHSGWPVAAHIIGKDILRFHAVYWPAMLMAAGLPPPRRVFGHGFLTKDGLKMGKSLGNVLDPFALVDAYGPDAVRFFFMKEVGFGADGDFSEPRFQATVNASLANDVGNLLKRALTLLRGQAGDRMPHSADDAQVLKATGLPALAERCTTDAQAAYEALRPHAAAEAGLALTSAANSLLSESQPWKLFKQGTEEDKTRAVCELVAVLESVRIASVILNPITPRLGPALRGQLGLPAAKPATWRDTAWGGLQEGTPLPEPQVVFPRIRREFVTTVLPNGAGHKRGSK